MEKRPRSSKWKSVTTSAQIHLSATELHDLARNPASLTSLASSYKTLTKSAVGFNCASKDVVRCASKQAWAPQVKQNLSSSSDRFRTEPPLPPNPATTPLAPPGEFGRVRKHWEEEAACTVANRVYYYDEALEWIERSCYTRRVRGQSTGATQREIPVVL